MITAKKFISSALAALMLASFTMSSASCKSNKTGTKTVQASDPWYTSKRIELDPKLNPDIYKDVIPSGPYLCHDKYVMTYHATKLRPNLSEFRPTDADLMGVFDLDGNLNYLIDLQGIMEQQKSAWGFFTVERCSESEKGVRLYFNEPVSANMYYCDISTGDEPQIDPAVKNDLGDMEDEIQSSGYFSDSFDLFEGYEVMVLRAMNNARLKIAVFKDMKALYCVDLEKNLGPGAVSFIYGCYGGGSGTVIFDAIGKEPLSFKLDLATGKVGKLTDKIPVSSNKMVSSLKDGTGYLTKATGIYEYDALTGDEILRLDFDSCNINRYESQSSTVLYYDDSKTILGCPVNMNQVYKYKSCDPAVIYVLEKADVNPNAGKAILTVASLGDDLSYFEGEALMKFNDQETEFFAKLSLYDQGDYLSAGDDTYEIDQIDINRYSAMALASGSLISDIRSGTGPDVILGAASSVDLLNSTYLKDLSSYLESKDFNPSKYYYNLIDKARTDGKTFFIPTAFTVTGIVTDGSDIDAYQAGFTYEQYASFVKDQLNGKEPVTSSSTRMHFLNLCIQRDYTGWIKDGKMDFDSSEFRELAGFFRDNIPEGMSKYIDVYNPVTDEIYSWHEPEAAVFSENIDSLFELAHINYYGKNIRVMGLPSSDGTGPSANITNSFSVTEGTSVEKGAYAFLDILISSDIQKKADDRIPINREAVVDKVKNEKLINEPYYDMLSSYDPGNLLLPLSDIMRADYVFDASLELDLIFLQMLDDVDSVMLSDNPVLMIVSEEIPPYLIGQKDLDSVIGTVNSRTRIVFDER